MTDTAQLDRTIGAIARAAGVNVETVRYYERIGVLPRPPRAQGSIRRYPADTLQRVRFIKRAQWLGFSLDEVAFLLALDKEHRCRRARALGEAKLALLRRKLDELAAARTVLEALLAQCATSRNGHCPLIDGLLREDDPRPASQRSRPRARTGASLAAALPGASRFIRRSPSPLKGDFHV